MSKSRSLAAIAIGLAALALAGCISGPATVANCAAANQKLAVAQAVLTSAEASIPALQLAAANALAAAGGNPSDRVYLGAQAALGVAQAGIPGLQAIVAANQAVVTSECSTVGLPSV